MPTMFESLLPPGDPVALTIRDALYDSVALTRAAVATIETPAFRRLEGVRQLGFVALVWPGARHTRFEHSLGVYHLAGRALARLLAPGGGLEGIEPAAVRALLAAALLHDVGHYPFSHAIEELGPPIEPHEQIGRRLIESAPLAEVIEREWGVSPGRVADLVDPPRGGLPAPDHLLARLLGGTLDVDKLDYLPRDARACNVPYAGVDVPRLLDSLRVRPGPDGAPRLAITPKGIGPLHALIGARQAMFDTVYWHHTNRAAMAMLLRAVQDAVEAGALAPADLVGVDDEELLRRLARPSLPASTRELVERLRARRLYKRVLEVSPRAGRLFQRLDGLFYDPPRRKRVEAALADSLAATLGEPVPDHALLIDIPKPERWETEVWVYDERPPLGGATWSTWVEATGMRPDDLLRYEAHRRRIRLVAAERFAARAAAAQEAAIVPVLERLGGLAGV